MLKGRPTTLDKAIEAAATVEEALCFGGTYGIEVPVNGVHSKDSGAEVEQLRHMLEWMSQKFESFEQQLKELDAGKTTNSLDSIKRNAGMPQ